MRIIGEYIIYSAIAVIFAVIGVVIGYIVRKRTAEKLISSAELYSNKLVAEAKREAESEKKTKLIEAKEEIQEKLDSLDVEMRERRSEMQALEKRNLQREEVLDQKSVQLEQKISQNEKKEEKLQKRQSELDKKAHELSLIEEKKIEELQRVSQLTIHEAKQILFDSLKKEVDYEAASYIRESEANAKERANKEAKEILAHAVQRCASDYVAETTVSVVDLPNDDMKGRIIGREGRNIRAFETITGVDLIIDDTPEAVILSCFDAYRREIAKRSLEKLILDVRIHPGKIEEIVEKTRKELDNRIRELGENAVYELGIHNMNPELIKYLGKMNYRTSYGQNVLKHSIEVAELAAIIASEMGANVKIAKRGGLLHDIGKSIDHEMEGTHVELGVKLLKKYKESEAVIHCCEAHHFDVEPQTVEALIVIAADTLSAARPGARRESIDNYIKRLENLEAITNSYSGVEKSFAIQAGREVRVLVQPEKINDDQMVVMSRDIKKRVEEELDYPGQIKIHIIRESRAIEYAR